MSPVLLTVLVIAFAATFYGLGHVVAGRHASRRELEAWNKGRDSEQANAREIATHWLARYPTSTGARKMARAIGVTVPPLPRVRRVEAVTLDMAASTTENGASPSVPLGLRAVLPADAGEGEE